MFTETSLPISYATPANPPVVSSLSQGQLNIWTTCPRKFQHYYWDSLGLPADSVQQERLELGAKFHLLMQQRELGLDITALAQSDRNLQQWLLAFANAPPVMIDGDRHCEHCRTLSLAVHGQEHVLTAIYDLLILGKHSAQILDWKTHQRPLSQLDLAANWQTRLYLYILANTTDYAAEQLSMTYWFANSASAVVVTYDRDKHQQTEQDLSQLLQDMAAAIASQSFAQLPLGHPECNKCEFAYRCQRAKEEQASLAIKSAQIAAIASYPEVPI